MRGLRVWRAVGGCHVSADVRLESAPASRDVGGEQRQGRGVACYACGGELCGAVHGEMSYDAVKECGCVVSAQRTDMRSQEGTESGCV